MRPILVVSPGAVMARDLPAGLARFDSVLLLAPEDWNELPAPLLSHVGELVRVPMDGGLPRSILERCRAFGPSGVATLSEQTMPLVGALTEALELPTLGAIEPLTDKVEQRRALREVDFTRSLEVRPDSDWARVALETGLPYVLKPVQGRGSRQTLLVRDPSEGPRLAASFWSVDPSERLAAEEYLLGRKSHPFGSFVSVESLVVDGEVTHFGVTGKLPQLAPFRETSHVYPAPLSDAEREEVEVLARHAVEAVGMGNGATHTEIKLTPRGPRVIEVNGRLGGYINEIYGRVLGVDIVDAAVRASCGQRVPIPNPSNGGVYLQYSHQPPRGATRLVAVDGARQVTRLPGVSRYDAIVRPGADLPDDSRSWDLNLICGKARTYAEMFDLLEEIHECLSFTFLSGGVELKVSGTGLALQEVSEPESDC